MSFKKEISHALLIGVGKRESDSEAMTITANDAKLLEKSLVDFNIFFEKNIKTLTNEQATRDNIIHNLDLLIKQTDKESADLVLLFFSGHGSKRGDSYHLVCRDTSTDFQKAIEGNSFIEKINAIKSDKMVVLLDCCHAEGISITNIPFHEPSYLEKPNRVILTACSKSQVSYVSKPLSLFTYALIEALGGKFLKDIDDKEVSIFSLAMDVRERVVSLVPEGKIQQPQLNVLQRSFTHNFTMARYPKGGPQEIHQLKTLLLQSFDGKDIYHDRPNVRDEIERAKFNWITINQTGEVINSEIVIQPTGNNYITINVNGKDISIQNEFYELKRILEQFGISNILYRDKNNPTTYDISDISEKNYDFYLGKKQFNEFLTKRVLEALSKRQSPAFEFLKSLNPGWEKDEPNADSAKLYITENYVGALAFQLRILIAIGKEPLSRIKLNNYAQQCLTTAKRTLQILTFSLVSKLWSIKSKIKFSLDQSQSIAIGNFFKQSREKDISYELNLLKALISIFDKNKLDFPLPEIEMLDLETAGEDSFVNLCFSFEEVKKDVETSSCTLQTCFRAEYLLTHLLEKTIFLADYRMISIKEIAYEELPYDPPQYFHNYSEISVSRKSAFRVDKVNYSPKSVWTDAVLLFKQDYLDSINLFPFIIDLNALTFEQGTKLYFYSSYDILNKYLQYRFIEDDRIDHLISNEPLNVADPINALRSEEIKQLKFNKVFSKFDEARKTILS